MFGNVVYYDKKKIDEYRSVIKGQRNLEVEEYEVSNDKGIQVDLNGCIQGQHYGNVAGNLSLYQLERREETDTKERFCYQKRSASLGA